MTLEHAMGEPWSKCCITIWLFNAAIGCLLQKWLAAFNALCCAWAFFACQKLYEVKKEEEQ